MLCNIIILLTVHSYMYITEILKLSGIVDVRYDSYINNVMNNFINECIFNFNIFSAIPSFSEDLSVSPSSIAFIISSSFIKLNVV